MRQSRTYQARLSGIPLVGILLFGGLVTAALPAQIYRWRDAEGSVHYSDRRPPEGAVQQIAPAPDGRNTISGLSPFERQQVRRFDERIREHLRARRAVARSLAGDQIQRARACEAIERKLDDLQSERHLGLSLSETNRAHSREWQLQRGRLHFCD